MGYDVFISFKHSDEKGRKTRDFRIAEDLYDKLTLLGYSVFFATSTLEHIGSSQYKKDIDEALDTAKAMVVVLTEPEYARSQWVQYEWDSFYNDYLSGLRSNANLFTLTDGVEISALPRTLRNVQNFDCAQGLEKVCSYLKGIFPREKSTGETNKIRTQQLDRRSPVGAKEKRQIAELLYKADPYIFPALFVDCEQAKKVLPKLFINDGGDKLFCLENIFAGFYEDALVGILLWHEGALDWDGEKLRDEILRQNGQISPYYQSVIDRYFSLYREGKEGRIYINFLQASEFCDIPGVEESILAEFISCHCDKEIEMRVFDESGEISLYGEQGFEQIELYRGFHVDENEEIYATVLLRKAEKG